MKSRFFRGLLTAVLLSVVTAIGISTARSAENTSRGATLKLQGKLVCIGASITAGEGVTKDECYVGLIRAQAIADHLDLEVIAQGRSGWDTGAYVANKKKICDAMPADATIISILLGTNDARSNLPPDKVAERAASNLGKLIDAYHERAPQARFVICAPTQCYPDKLTKRLVDAHYGERTPANLEQISKAFAKVADDRQIQFIDLSSLPSKADFSIDGVHPNVSGHQELFHAFWSHLTHSTPPTTQS